MINKDDAEIYLGLSRDKTDVLDKLVFALQSIAASLIVNKVGIVGSEKFVEKMSEVVKEKKEVKETAATESIRRLACAQCIKGIDQEEGNLVYWYGTEPFCSNEHRVRWMEEHGEGVHEMEEKKPMNRPSASGGVL